MSNTLNFVVFYQNSGCKSDKNRENQIGRASFCLAKNKHLKFGPHHWIKQLSLALI